MSLNAIETDTISRMMYSAISGNLSGAIAVLNQTGLSEAQKAKIEGILKDPRSTMQQSIVAVFAEKNITPVAISSHATPVAPSEQQDVSFADATTSLKRPGETSDEEPLAKKSKTACANPQAEHMEDTDENAPGTSLMHLNGEQGAIAPVEPSRQADKSVAQALPTGSEFIAHELCSDIVKRIFYACASQCNFETLTAAARVNKLWNKCSNEFWEGVDLKDLTQLCPELTILDAQAQGVECKDEPKINKFRLIKGVREMSPLIEGNEGVTLLTMAKAITLNQLMEIAEQEGLDIVSDSKIIKKLGDVAVKQTYRILITNNFFMNSQNKALNFQKKLVEGHGCKVPTIQEYVALCVFTYSVFKKHLYAKPAFAYGSSSTHIMQGGKIHPVMHGRSATGYVCAIFDIEIGDVVEQLGAGGKREF